MLLCRIPSRVCYFVVSLLKYGYSVVSLSSSLLCSEVAMSLLMCVSLFWCLYVSFGVHRCICPNGAGAPVCVWTWCVCVRARACVCEEERECVYVSDGVCVRERERQSSCSLCCEFAMSVVMYICLFWWLYVSFYVYMSLLMFICLIWCI